MNKIKGNYFEEYTLLKLQKSGFKLVARNYRIFNTEVDLIVRKNNLIYLIEVKYRKYNYEFEYINSYLQRQFFRLKKVQGLLKAKSKFKLNLELWLFLYMQKNKKMITLRRLKLP